MLVKQLKTKQKNKKGDLLACEFLLLSTLGASLLGNLLACKSVIRASEGTIRPGTTAIKWTEEQYF